MKTRADNANKMDQSGRLLTTFLAAILIQVSDANSWAEWWAYDQGISGPNFWGLLNPRWVLCNKGHNQSPVNIDPKTLLFDPSLSPIEIKGMAVSGELVNRGHSLIFEIDLASHWSPGVNITGGPLSYRYRICELSIHFGHTNEDGSEHTVDGTGFTAEIQMVGFNSDLYPNVTTATMLPRGLVYVSILAKVSNQTHQQFERIHKAINETTYKGERKHVSYLNIRRLLPDTEHYVTYEGSLTHPACHETVTWIIYNKPIYISQSQIAGLRRLKQDSIYNPVLLMAGNIRPLQPLNQRTVRTNINFSDKSCSMVRHMNYMGVCGDDVKSNSCSESPATDWARMVKAGHLITTFCNKEPVKTFLNDGNIARWQAVSFGLRRSETVVDTR